MSDRLPYPPPYQDMATLCAHLCISEATVDIWVKKGKLPPPKVHGDTKRLWKWSEVVKRLEGSDGAPSLAPDDRAQEITHATRQAATARR